MDDLGVPEDDVHALSLVPSTFVKWFTTAVTPAPPGALMLHDVGQDRVMEEHAVALLHQFAYPADDYGWREPGSDWVDSRVILGFVEPDGSVVPAETAQPLTNPECSGPKTVLPDADDE